MTGPQWFRKKPVVVEAIQWTSAARPQDLVLWIRSAGSHAFVRGDGLITISTLEGEMVANPGDWIVRGIKSEHYPVKPDIFEATYESVGLQVAGQKLPDGRRITALDPFGEATS